MTQIYYDITDILEYARHNSTLSGIQRVSLELLSLMVSKHGSHRLKVIAFHPIMKRVVSYDPSCFAQPYEFDQGEFCQMLGLSAPIGDLEFYLDHKYGKTLKRHFHRGRLSALNGFTRGSTLRKRDVDKGRPLSLVRELANTAPRFQAGDVVLVPGATWDFEGHMSFLAGERRNSSIKLFHFIHDLIPLMALEHVGDDVPERFSRWLGNLCRNTDRFITNSEATKRDLDSWMSRNGFRVESRVVKLAHQFCSVERTVPTGELDDPVGISTPVRNAARCPYVLCVGTIESRKNVWTLANVWKRIYEKLGNATPRLIFAGKHGGWKEDFDDFMKGTGSLYGYIRIVQRPSDAELSYLYRKCLFSIFPSYIEGWGLPVGECLWFGRPVICSNTSSMPEVGGSLADYIDPVSPASIEAAALRMITDIDYREQRVVEIVSARLRTWSNVADDLWRELAMENDDLASVAHSLERV